MSGPLMGGAGVDVVPVVKVVDLRRVKSSADSSAICAALLSMRRCADLQRAQLSPATFGSSDDTAHDGGRIRDEDGVRCSSDDVTTDRRASRTRPWSVHRRAVARRPHSFAKQPSPRMSRPRCFYLDRSGREHLTSMRFVLVVEDHRRCVDRRPPRAKRMTAMTAASPRHERV